MDISLQQFCTFCHFAIFVEVTHEIPQMKNDISVWKVVLIKAIQWWSDHVILLETIEIWANHLYILSLIDFNHLFNWLPLLPMIYPSTITRLMSKHHSTLKSLLVVAKLSFPPLTLIIPSILSTLEGQKMQCKSPNHCTTLRPHWYILMLFAVASYGLKRVGKCSRVA